MYKPALRTALLDGWLAYQPGFVLHTYTTTHSYTAPILRQHTHTHTHANFGLLVCHLVRKKNMQAQPPPPHSTVTTENPKPRKLA